MKKIILGATLFLGTFIVTQKAEAQIRVGVNINIGDQPTWRDTRYDYVEYYYLPDIESYYYVPSHQFIYLSGGRWIRSSSLPPSYRSYNLRTGNKIVINRSNAYNYFEQDRRKYPRNNSWRGNNGNHNGWKKHGRRH